LCATGTEGRAGRAAATGLSAGPCTEGEPGGSCLLVSSIEGAGGTPSFRGWLASVAWEFAVWLSASEVGGAPSDGVVPWATSTGGAFWAGADVAADGVELRSAELSAGGFAGVTPPVCNIGRNSHHANAPSANRERTTITGATREALGSSSSSK